jgi:Aerotolerance regulator N-terminal
MLALFATPWALLALLAIPALAVIYWLRNRYRRVPVSSLMLWAQERENRAGGLHVHRLQTPLLFFLELLAIVLLVFAAAGPLLSSTEESRPLVVVLDDSYSMLAGALDSPQSRGRAAALEEIRRGGYQSVRLVLAGDHPQVLGVSVRTSSEVLAQLEGWHCQTPTADLEGAIGLAAEVGGPRAQILVLSDHAPAVVPGRGSIQWRAFGTAHPNTAFVAAARSGSGGHERCSFEIANFSPQSVTTYFVVETGSPAVVLQRSSLQLAAMETRRIVLQLPPSTPAVEARLSADALKIDDRVILLSNARPPVRVAVELKDPTLRAMVEKALKASGRAVVTTAAPELLFTSEDDAPGATAWQVQLLRDKEAEAYVGPFVMERTHPLTQGLSLDGVVWGAGKTPQVSATPIILAGNVPLLTDSETAGGGHRLRLHFRPDLSMLQDSPSWPILICNMLEWRAATRAGLQRVNLRLGEAAALVTSPGVENVLVTDPGGVSRPVPVHYGRAVIRAETVGRYGIQAGDQQYAFAVNALNREESNLTHCGSGRWGEWSEPSAGTSAAHSASWILLLAAVTVLALHLWLVAGKRGKGGQP